MGVVFFLRSFALSAFVRRKERKEEKPISLLLSILCYDLRIWRGFLVLGLSKQARCMEFLFKFLTCCGLCTF